MLTEDLQMIYVELPKFHKDSIDKLESGMDIWLFLLIYSQTLTEEDTLKLKQKLPDLQNAFGVLESLNRQALLYCGIVSCRSILIYEIPILPPKCHPEFIEGWY